ncbi:MAG TPA: hypothetical protein VG225_18080 [Terracidiphilus sp.]|jgi:hypothetical protein|nr:hypothetical protein [Terracidiphilus sp.]
MMRWLRAAILGLAAFGVISFALDWTVFKLTGSPKSKFTVSHFVSAPLKNNKQEIDFIGSEDEPCSLTVYPQDGYMPCWYLRRHTNQVTTY